MLRAVLPLASSGHARTPTETNSKLLELADRDTHDEDPSSAGTEQDLEAEEEAVPSASAIASVVTQAPPPGPSAAAASRTEQAETRSSWKSRFR